MLLHTALCAAVIVCLTETVHGSSVTSYDICKKKILQLDSVDKSGILTFDNSSKNQDYSCVLKIEACSSCQIELQPTAKTSFDFKCPSGAVSLRYCTLGCDYLYMFDTNYMNETMQFYQSLGKYQEPFKSESKSVFILLCHGFSEDYSFQIAYKTTRKLVKIQGLSDSSLAFGYINSPFFPLGYAQSQEVYEYQFNSTKPGDYVQLMFDDWHLTESAVFFFDKSNVKTQVSGRISRPVVISDKNFLRFTFQTGVTRAPGENRDYLGFRASYKFYSSRIEIPQPKTYCGPESYYMSSVGGKIEFTTKSPTREIYDCLWVLKKEAGFDGIFMKIERFRSNTHHFDPVFEDNTLMIRDGVTSIGPVVQIVKMKQLQDSNDGVVHFSNVGFYLRLNATMSSVTTLVVTYASYKDKSGCTPSLYMCENRRCIDPGLVCDGTDHCGDNSDEVAGCSNNDSEWGKSYQYTITIGVIVPMVISVFLIMVICLLFVMIRKCRRAQLREAAGSNERLRTVSEEVSEQHGGRRRRRRRRGLFGQGERDMPPTYDEAMQNPPGWYQNVAFGNPVDPTLPQPPSYHEAISGQNPEQSTSNQHNTPGSPVSTDSSQSELTMCSANLSDSSSSSDEGSTWGIYSGEGEGRRGRLGRHVSSSGSETYTTVDQSQSPNQNEAVPVNASHDNVSRDNVSSPDIEMRNIHDNVNHRVKRDNKSHDKNHQKIATSEPDDFVVPAGPKPGGSESSAVNRQPRPRGPDVILFRDSRKPSTSAPRPAPRKSLDYRKNATQESEAAMATGNQQIKHENSRPPERNGTNAGYDRSDSSCQESENTDTFYDAGNSVAVGTAYPNDYRQHQNQRESSPSGLVTESSPAQRRSVHEGIDEHLQNRAVVNVDDDNVIYMYDSQSSINRSGIVPSQYLLSQAQGTDQRNVSYERNPHSNGAVRRRADVGEENVDRVSQRYLQNNRHFNDTHRSAGHMTRSTDRIWDDTVTSANHMTGHVDRSLDNSVTSAGHMTGHVDRNFDDSVTSAGHMTGHVDRNFDDSVTSAGSSEQLSFTSRNGRGSGSEQLQSSHLSLNAELDDLEDVYV